MIPLSVEQVQRKDFDNVMIEIKKSEYNELRQAGIFEKYQADTGTKGYSKTVHKAYLIESKNLMAELSAIRKRKVIYKWKGNEKI